MDNKRILLIGGIVIVVLALAITLVYFLRVKAPTKNPGDSSALGGNEFVASETREEVPENIQVPDLNSQVEDDSIAVPIGVTDAAPGVKAQLRVFNISAEGGLFKPSTVIANKGDTVHINFTAVDKSYDMVLPDYGMKQTADKGETKVFEFQAVMTGKFTYYCDSCGGLDSQTKGYIIIAEQ
jgi:plastocyanin